MNYLQIEIGGKKRGLKFNRATDHELLIKVGKSKNPVFYSYALIWAALTSNCLVKGEEPDFTFENVCDWCEEIKDEKVYTEILKVYQSTHDFEKSLPKGNKKKLTDKSTKTNALK